MGSLDSDKPSSWNKEGLKSDLSFGACFRLLLALAMSSLQPALEHLSAIGPRRLTGFPGQFEVDSRNVLFSGSWPLQQGIR